VDYTREGLFDGGQHQSASSVEVTTGNVFRFSRRAS
jgi:hypothetical protein